MQRKSIVLSAAGIATATVLGLGGVALANAGPTMTAAPQATGTHTASAHPGAAGKHGSDPAKKGKAADWIAKHGVSGDAAVNVTKAATAAEPTAALVGMSKTDSGYRVMMARPDGTRVVLTLDTTFAVTDKKEHAKAATSQGQRTKAPKAPKTSAPSST